MSRQQGVVNRAEEIEAIVERISGAQDVFEALGCVTSSTEEGIKSQMGKLLFAIKPDKITDLPEGIRKSAEEAFEKLQNLQKGYNDNPAKARREAESRLAEMEARKKGEEDKAREQREAEERLNQLIERVANARNFLRRLELLRIQIHILSNHHRVS